MTPQWGPLGVFPEDILSSGGPGSYLKHIIKFEPQGVVDPSISTSILAETDPARIINDLH
jgi:hypothetical protein